jgi:hypothetical protein
VARLEEERDAASARAVAASSGDERASAELQVRRLDRQIRLARTYPVGIWLAGAAVLAPLLVWAVLQRHGHGVLGLVLGLALAGAEALGALVRRRGRA